MDSLIENIPKIIDSSGNLFGLVALAIIIFAFVDFIFFRNAETRQKERIFFITTLFFLALVLPVLAASTFAKPGYPIGVPPLPNNVIGHVVVNATTGFQSSGIYLTKNQKVILEPEGRVHLASDQLDDFTRLVKPFIAENLPDGKKYNDLKNNSEYKLPDELDKIIFRRGWIGIEGEGVSSDFHLNDCKLIPNKNWGRLLAVVIPPNVDVSAEPDPFKVLAMAKLKLENLHDVFEKKDLTARYDGWLTFIINDAIISDVSPSQFGQDYYAALKRASEELSSRRREDYQKIPLSSIPLVWYADNVGSFQVTVKRG